jgi:hypothetical protein
VARKIAAIKNTIYCFQKMSRDHWRFNPDGGRVERMVRRRQNFQQEIRLNG